MREAEIWILRQIGRYLVILLMYNSDAPSADGYSLFGDDWLSAVPTTSRPQPPIASRSLLGNMVMGIVFMPVLTHLLFPRRLSSRLTLIGLKVSRTYTGK